MASLSTNYAISPNGGPKNSYAVTKNKLRMALKHIETPDIFEILCISTIFSYTKEFMAITSDPVRKTGAYLLRHHGSICCATLPVTPRCQALAHS